MTFEPLPRRLSIRFCLAVTGVLQAILSAKLPFQRDGGQLRRRSSGRFYLALDFRLDFITEFDEQSLAPRILPSQSL